MHQCMHDPICSPSKQALEGDAGQTLPSQTCDSRLLSYSPDSKGWRGDADQTTDTAEMMWLHQIRLNEGFQVWFAYGDQLEAPCKLLRNLLIVLLSLVPGSLAKTCPCHLGTGRLLSGVTLAICTKGEQALSISTYHTLHGCSCTWRIWQSRFKSTLKATAALSQTANPCTHVAHVAFS